jgi:hypothetical protein
MGLDMYLKKSKRVEGLSAEDYSKVSNEIPWDKEEYNKKAGLKGLCPDIDNVENLNECVREEGGSFKYLTIFKEVGYWRKANAIHGWFVEKCQDGVDECQLTEVSKEKLETLLSECYKVANKKGSPEELLPTGGGFFFGGTEYDEYYIDMINETIGILERTINDTDFDEEIMFYRSSW